MRLATEWKDYECLDAGDKEKLERWQPLILRRPDPTAIWHKTQPQLWARADALYHRSDKGGGYWESPKKLPNHWKIHYKDRTFKVAPTDFKHTGLFPEQAVNWDWLETLDQKHPGMRILNLFAYTGAADLAFRNMSELVHVDAAKGMVQWAQENRDLSGLQALKIRYIVDDVMKFVAREKRRGHTYHGIIMDPPSYGRGPSGEIWKIDKELPDLIELCLDLLAEDAVFMLINTYTTALAPSVVAQLSRQALSAKQFGGSLDAQEIGLPMQVSPYVLPCGVSTRWCAHERDL